MDKEDIFALLYAILFSILKLNGVIDFPWIWAFIPIIGIGIGYLLGFVIAIVLLVVNLIKK